MDTHETGVGVGFPRCEVADSAKPLTRSLKQKHSRWWEVRDQDDELVCLTVYRKGAREVVRRLAA
ncbi:MAG TPA: hypothetical protein VF092_15740 [Longimicrobium sp.]